MVVVTNKAQIEEILARLKAQVENGKEILQPSILLNQEFTRVHMISEIRCVNITDGEELPTLHPNNSRWGWLLMRVQTEFRPTGHVTMAYLVKMHD
jgi:hypothetical protein